MKHIELIKIAESWQQRSDEQNTIINQQWLNDRVVHWQDINFENPMWVFSHIPKTAGTSLESYLHQAFTLKDILNVNAPDLNRLPQCVYLKNKFPKFITGHHPIHGMLYQLLPDRKVVHISMMREPVTRVISYYNYLASRNYHALHQQVKDLSFDEFIHRQDMVELHNGQAKRMAGYLHTDQTIKDSELYRKAKHVVDHCFSLIGVTEHFKQFHQLIARLCGVSFHHLPPINRSKIKIQLTDLSSEQRNIIKQKNKVDIQLYEYVKSLFIKRYEQTIGQ